ncbi:SDR family oxidoreductase [Algoriphagus sp. A40]|uniref:dTDP-4-dehydrorhamnose reductase family protein n=1 Tax=Algoriphagus sp. A40 TaxID=1945863 RepID=UPI0009874672|nr:SDR family oxidoreductase [Algoriphagus sp. A40]OOG67951.1 NAD(P)-dependent oxidoreductase [Algoriphagus sp. A40]
MKKVLILGSTGMLGHQVYFKLKDNPAIHLMDLSFRNKLHENTVVCDITDSKKLSEIIQDYMPDVIVNCIGILIKGSQFNPKNSIFINAYFPHWLTAEADNYGGQVIHISTDCVFSGKKGGYLESDFRDADDVYGRGKALGELFSKKHLTLRTSIIGPELKVNGEGLFHWFMNQTGDVNGYTEAYWGGVTTTELAKVIEECIEHPRFGLYHITNGSPISKFELLKLFNSSFKRCINVQPFEGKKVDKSLKTEFETEFKQIPTYHEMIDEMKMFMESNSSLYIPIYPSFG